MESTIAYEKSIDLAREANWKLAVADRAAFIPRNYKRRCARRNAHEIASRMIRFAVFGG